MVLNLAVAYAHQGRDVMIVDADPQRSVARWHADRIDEGHAPAIACVEKLGNVREALLDLRGRYDEVIVDVAGKDSREMRTAMTATDQLVVAVRPSQLDLDTLAHMSQVIEAASDFNPGMDVRGLLTQAPTNPRITERVEAADYLAEYPILRPLESVIYERKVYRDTLGEGRGVVESANPQARAEVLELAAELTIDPRRDT